MFDQKGMQLEGEIKEQLIKFINSEIKCYNIERTSTQEGQATWSFSITWISEKIQVSLGLICGLNEP